MKAKTVDVIEYIYRNNLQHVIAEACGITRQAIAQWTEVPWNRVLIVEQITGLPRHQIRPDIYPANKRTL